MHKAHRLVAAAPVRSRDARDAHGQIDRRGREQPSRHGAGTGLGHRPMVQQNRVGNAEQGLLGAIRIGDQRAVEAGR